MGLISNFVGNITTIYYEKISIISSTNILSLRWRRE